MTILFSTPASSPLTGVPAGRKQRRLAAGIAVLILLLAFLAARVASHTVLEVRPFLPMFANTVILLTALTAFLLLGQGRYGRDAYLCALSAPYSFTAVLATVQVLVFPGVFTPSGLLGASPQSATWIWVIWHIGFPGWVLIAMLLRQPAGVTVPVPARHRWALALAMLAPALALLFGALVVREGAEIASLISRQSYAALSHSYLGFVVVGINGLALLVCLLTGRLRCAVDLWLTVALLASLADAALTLLAGVRFSIGWYTARFLSLVSAAVLLGLMLYEIAALYQRLIRANADLAALAHWDALTGIANRQSFNQRWAIESARANRDNMPLSVLMIDVDHFKSINDRFGHDQGDAYLQALASLLKRTMQRRASDFVARYGGEEFVAILPETDAAGAANRAEVFRAALAAEPFPAMQTLSGELVPGGMTVSIGIASVHSDPLLEEAIHEQGGIAGLWPGQPVSEQAGVVAARMARQRDIQHLLVLADAALYEAKGQGRNRVIVGPVRPPPMRHQGQTSLGDLHDA